MSDFFEFYSMDYVIEETRKYKKHILEKTKMKDEEFELLLSLIMENIRIIPDHKIRENIGRAIEIMGNIDKDDGPIMACAMSIPNEGIWTHDRHFLKQTLIKVWSTKDLLEYI